jgi:hypothetical protein
MKSSPPQRGCKHIDDLVTDPRSLKGAKSSGTGSAAGRQGEPYILAARRRGVPLSQRR